MSQEKMAKAQSQVAARLFPFLWGFTGHKKAMPYDSGHSAASGPVPLAQCTWSQFGQWGSIYGKGDQPQNLSFFILKGMIHKFDCFAARIKTDDVSVL